MLDPPAGRLLFASDAVVEGVHFRRDISTLSQVMQKVVTSNVSDIFAMGGEPVGMTLSAGIPPGCSEEDLVSIVDGLRCASDVYAVRLLGGDTVRSPHGYFFDVAILGSVPAGREPLRRSGARPGDAIVVFGELGGSLAGFWILERLAGGGRAALGGRAAAGGVVTGGDGAAGSARFSGWPDGTDSLEGLVPRGREGEAFREIIPGFSLDSDADDLARLVSERGLGPECAAAALLACRHLCPRTRIPGALLSEKTRGAIRAAIDVSDGLAKDLRSLCEESGVGAVIDALPVPVPDAVRRAAGEEGALAMALESGEEYVLLAAAEKTGALGEGAFVIGEIVEEGEGVLLRSPDGLTATLPPAGYEHEF